MRRTGKGKSAIGTMMGSAVLLATTAGASHAWETPVWISPPAVETTGVPGLAVDGKGNAYFSYFALDGVYWRLTVAQKPAGGALEPGVAVSPSGTSAWEQSMKADKSGNVVVAWNQDGLSMQALYVATKDKKSATFGAPVQLGGEAYYYDFLVNLDRKRNTTVVWNDGTLASATRPKKGDFGAPVVIRPDGGLRPFLTSDGKGNALLLWSESDGLGGYQIARSVRPAGGSFDTPAVVSSGLMDLRPVAAFDKKGNATAIWQGSVGPQWGVTVADSPAASLGTFGSSSMISSLSDGVDPQIAIDSKGNALAVWSREESGHYRIEVAERPYGGTFGAVTVISDVTSTNLEPQVVIDQKGNAYVIWRGDDGGDYTIEVARRPAGGVFGPVEMLYQGPESVGSFPRIAVDKKGNLYAEWIRSDGALPRIEGTWELAN